MKQLLEAAAAEVAKYSIFNSFVSKLKCVPLLYPPCSEAMSPEKFLAFMKMAPTEDPVSWARYQWPVKVLSKLLE